MNETEEMERGTGRLERRETGQQTVSYSSRCSRMLNL